MEPKDRLQQTHPCPVPDFDFLIRPIKVAKNEFGNRPYFLDKTAPTLSLKQTIFPH
jgi:hypothetical protein